MENSAGAVTEASLKRTLQGGGLVWRPLAPETTAFLGIILLENLEIILVSSATLILF